MLRDFSYDDDELRALSLTLDPYRTNAAGVYPLARPGERFPFADPGKRPAVPARDDQCPRNPEKTRVFRTLEASISVAFQSIRLLLGPLIISARVLEIETQTSLASTRTKSR